MRESVLPCWPSWLVATLLVGRPEREIIAQELHDESRILVGVFLDVVELGNGIFECGACHFASLIRILEHLVLEDGVVERKTKTDRMSHWKIFLSNFVRLLIGQASVLSCLGLGVAVSELGDVAVVIGLHLVVE